MHKISLLSDVSIWTVEDGPLPVKEMQEPRTVYSPYGKPSKIWATSNGLEEIGLVHLDTGNRLGFGMSHEFMARTYDSPKPRPIGMRQIADETLMCMLPMPTRKAFLFPDTERREYVQQALQMALNNYSEDEPPPPDARSEIFLEVDNVDDMLDYSTFAGFLGMSVRLSASAHRIELDEGRPSCFAMKLLINSGVDDMVNALIDKNVLKPALPYDRFLKMAMETGCLFEGYSVADLRTILGILPTTKQEETWTVHSDDPSTTIELAFVRT